MNKGYFHDKEEMNFDYRFLVQKVWTKKIIILMIVILSAITMFLYSSYYLAPKYRSFTKLYIVNHRDTTANVTAQDLQLGNLLMQDYKEIILSNTVLESVANNFHLSTSSLASKISISSPRDNRILTITVSDTDPQRAAQIANRLREKSITTIKEVAKVNDITTIDVAKPSTHPYSPNVRRNTFLTAFIALVISIAFFVLKEVIDDRIKSEEDVENLLGETLLGIIPQAENKEKKGKKK